MATPFLGELKLVAFDFAPMGWAFCNGQLLSIAQNTALFALLGTQYGGDGQTTFALPNLQGAVPLGTGPGYTQGQAGGATAIQLTLAQMPVHSQHAAVPGAELDHRSARRLSEPRLRQPPWAACRCGRRGQRTNRS